MGATATRLYTPELLALAVSLADYPMHDGLPLKGEAHSRTCGSSLRLGMSIDGDGAIEGVGMAVSACAVGQAAAAIFAAAVSGRDDATLSRNCDGLRLWLSGDGKLPDWPGIEAIEPARMHSGRHGAMMLPWRAAMVALSKGPVAR